MSYRQQVALFEKCSVLLFASFTLSTAGVAFAQSRASNASGETEINAAFTQADKNADHALNMEEAGRGRAVQDRRQQA